MNIGKSLKVAMAINERNTKWVADELDASVSWVNMIKGQIGVNPRSLKRLADLFDMSVSEFVALGE